MAVSGPARCGIDRTELAKLVSCCSEHHNQVQALLHRNAALAETLGFIPKVNQQTGPAIDEQQQTGPATDEQ